MRDTTTQHGILPRIIRPRIGWKLSVEDVTTVLGKSMTVPDEALSLKDLLERYTTGMPMPAAQREIYADGEIEPDVNDLDLMYFNRLDITEKEEIIELLKLDRDNALNEIEKRREEEAQKKAQKTAEKKAAIEAKKEGEKKMKHLSTK